jgi:hypothetical protein
MHSPRIKTIYTSPASYRKITPWPESASEIYRPSDGRLLANLVPNFAFRGCYVARAADPYSRILGFVDRSRYYFFQVALQFHSRGWVDPVPDSLLLRKSGRPGNRTRTSGSVVRNSVHWTTGRSTFFYITDINSVRTSQETQYISVL